MNNFPQILPVRKQDQIIFEILKKRLDRILPSAMREANVDMWVIICQEDDYDPVFKTLIPMNTWAPILQMLIFFDRGEVDGIEKINLSMTDTRGLYSQPWKGFHHEEQWVLLAKLIKERNPKRIGMNIGKINWASGGLTHNLYIQLINSLPEMIVKRIVSAEEVCTRWLMTLLPEELDLFRHVAKIGHQLITNIYSSQTIIPGVTTTEDLEWAYYQLSVDYGLELAFKPFYRIIRSEKMKKSFPTEDKIIRKGDLLHCDVGIRHLRLNCDNQEWAYVLRENEDDVPAGFKDLLEQNIRLQKIFMEEFFVGLTGNELLRNILERANKEGIPNPRVYSHSLGLYLHQPGPLIGLPWEQNKCEGRGDVRLMVNSCFTMELSIEDKVAEWDHQNVRLSTEQDVMFTEQGCELLDGKQTRFYLI
jgi:hypothetical protein